MTFDIITIFPGFFASILEHGLLKRACAGGQATIRIHDLRDFTDDRHRTVDDRPFGGGPGMVFKPEPVFRAVEALGVAPAFRRAQANEDDGESLEQSGAAPVILLSPRGRLFRQAMAEDLAREPRIILICGRYEGVDERVATDLATDELSVGDYVLSGGELAAAVVMEAVTRLLPGVLGNEESSEQDSFVGGEEGTADERGGLTALRQYASRLRGRRGGLLDCPHYTRPAEFRGLRVPEVLLSGNHTDIRQWRRRQALLKTWTERPDLLEGFPLTAEDERWLADFAAAGHEPAPAEAGRRATL